MNNTEKEFVKNECSKCKSTNAADCHIVRRNDGKFDCCNKNIEDEKGKNNNV